MEMNFRSYFHFKWFPNRERERERARGRRRRSLQSSPTIAGEPRAPVRRSYAPISSIAASRRSHRAARSHELQSNDRTAPFASRRSHRVARSRLRSRLRAISPSTHRSLSLCDFDFCVILIFVVVGVVWWWCFGGCGF